MDDVTIANRVETQGRDKNSEKCVRILRAACKDSVNNGHTAYVHLDTSAWATYVDVCLLSWIKLLLDVKYNLYCTENRQKCFLDFLVYMQACTCIKY